MQNDVKYLILFRFSSKNGKYLYQKCPDSYKYILEK